MLNEYACHTIIQKGFSNLFCYHKNYVHILKFNLREGLDHYGLEDPEDHNGPDYKFLKAF